MPTLYRITLPIFACLVLFANVAAADTWNVPGDFATIQTAIDNASDGDTILVADGTYNETLNVHVPNLTLLSLSGRDATTISADPGAAVALVTVAAPGLTFGAPEQGFTLRHATLNADHVFEVITTLVGEPGVFEAAPIRFEGNRLTGNDAEWGFHTNEALVGVDLFVIGNEFVKASGATYGFETPIYLYSSPFGDFGSVCLVNCRVEVRDNKIKDFIDEGIYLDNDAHASAIVIDSNDIVAVGASADGLYWSDYPVDGTTFEFTRNLVEDCEYGIDVYEPRAGATMLISGNRFTNFSDTGISLDYVGDGGEASITDNRLFGGSTAAYGIYVDETYYGVALHVDGNSINKVTDAGIYLGTNEYMPLVSIQRNTIDAGAMYGIHLFSSDSVNWVCRDNHVSGHTVAGFFAEGVFVNGTHVDLGSNTFAGDGAAYGINFDDHVDRGTSLLVRENTISGFETAAISQPFLENGSSSMIKDNVATAEAGSTTAYGIELDLIQYGCDISVVGNTLDLGGGLDGMVLRWLRAGCDASFLDNHVFNFGGYGLRIETEVSDGTSLTVSDNRFEGDPASPCLGGVWLNDVGYGSDAWVTGNHASNFSDSGVYANHVYYGTDLICDNNELFGAETGAKYGIWVEHIQYGAMATSFSSNTITNIADDGTPRSGIYLGEIYESCFVDIIHNILTAHSGGGANGIALGYIEYGARANVERNEISGFTEVCLRMLNDVYAGSELTAVSNLFQGGDYGMLFTENVLDGATVKITDNAFHDFKTDGIFFLDVIAGSEVTIERNIFDGDSASCAIRVFKDVKQASKLFVQDNCFRSTPVGIIIEKVIDAASVVIYGNDFSGVTSEAIRNVAGDANHKVDARENYLNGLGVFGEVEIAPEMLTPPDADGDGVPNCEDLCSGTAQGAAVDADGCATGEETPGTGGEAGNENPGDPGDPGTGSPGDGSTPDANANPCGCGSGADSAMMMPTMLIGFRKMRRRSKRRRK